MVCLHTYPPHPGRLSRRYPIVYLLVVILYHARLGFPFLLLPSSLTIYLGKQAPCARSVSRRGAWSYVRSGRSGYMLPPTMERYDVIYQDDERIARQPERLEKGVGENTRSHPRAQSARPRPADPPGRLRTGVG